MRDVSGIFGKRLVSDQPIKMYFGSPGSDNIVTLPAGKPSPVIDSYLQSGFFQVKGTENGYFYIKDENVEIVDPDAKDQSSIFQKTGYFFADLWNFNASKAVKQSGYLSDGFKESISNVKLSGFELSKQLRYILIGAGVLVFLLIIKDLIKS